MNAVDDGPETPAPPTAKQRLLQEAPGWTEDQARQALAAATGRIIDDWGDLGAQSDALTRRAMRDLDEEERAAGLEPWRREDLL
jgi:hypothetical protein